MDGPVGYLLIGSLIYGFTGGMTTFFMAVFSYLSQISKSDNRSARIAVVYAFNTLPHAISTIVSGVLLDNTGYLTVYSLVLLSYVATIAYMWWWLPEINLESKKPSTDNKTFDSTVETKADHNALKNLPLKERIYALFNFQHFKESFIVTFQKRPGDTRKRIILIVAALFSLGITSGNYNICCS